MIITYFCSCLFIAFVIMNIPLSLCWVMVIFQNVTGMSPLYSYSYIPPKVCNLFSASHLYLLNPLKNNQKIKRSSTQLNLELHMFLSQQLLRSNCGKQKQLALMVLFLVLGFYFLFRVYFMGRVIFPVKGSISCLGLRLSVDSSKALMKLKPFWWAEEC